MKKSIIAAVFAVLCPLALLAYSISVHDWVSPSCTAVILLGLYFGVKWDIKRRAL